MNSMNNDIDNVEVIPPTKKRKTHGRAPQMYDMPPADDVRKAFNFALAARST